MKISNLILCIFCLLYLCSASFALGLDPAKFMDIDEIKPGMKGIGKTVFQGTKVEEFQIEVLSIDRNFIGPKNDIIWVMCSGGPLEETGVISGMSGSPVYINGKLIGAIAYRVGSFPKRPIAGVTPIASMLKIFESEKSDTGIPRSSALYPESNLLSFNIQNIESSVQYPETNVTPIQMPVVMSGFHPNVMAEMSPFMKKMNMVPVQGGGSSVVETKEVNMEPGSTVCIELMKGDAGAYASGTLTLIEGDKILALGHPMMDGMGKMDLPLSLGYVGLLIPSMMASSKRASPIKSIGSLTYDAQTGIAGTIGKQTEFIPVKIRIKSQNRGQTQEYNYEVVKNKFIAPNYVFASALSSIYIAEKSAGDYTIKAHWEIKLKDRPAIIKDDIFSGMSPGTAALAFATPLAAIMDNSFEEVDVENLLLEIVFEDRRTNAVIDSIQINRNIIRPGDTLEVTVSLRPYMADIVTKKFQVVIPRDIPEGPAILWISDANAYETWERSRAPLKLRISNLDQLIRRIQDEESNNNIIVEILSPKLGITIEDQELPALPLSTLTVMSSPKQTGTMGTTRGTTFLKQRVSTEYVISGSATMILNIDRNAQY